ncbi:MAG TPA: hypothetical protein VHT53_00005 [Candidatus Elarobacter sp.]|nr:hypothetical protein [Candidatus Elarobacter sp.]
MRVSGAAALTAALVLAAGAALLQARVPSAPAPAPVPVLQQAAAAIDRQYHACVPLGWYPDRLLADSYLPGYTAVVSDANGILQPLWVGVVRTRELRDPHAVSVKAVLDELARTGMMVRRDIPGGFRYNLTREGASAFYQDDEHGNNPEAWPYLCFSRLHATHVARTSHAPETTFRYAAKTAERIRFTWEPTPDAPWVTPFLKAHAVRLDPTSSPAEATVVQAYDGRWQVGDVDFGFPVLENRSAWAAHAATAAAQPSRGSGAAGGVVIAALIAAVCVLGAFATTRLVRRRLRPS